MLTKKDILLGLQNGVVKLVPDPSSETGVMCRIGDGLFYFAGEEGETMTAEEYERNVPQSEIAEEIHEALMSFRYYPEFFDEYIQYSMVLEPCIRKTEVWEKCK